VPFGVSDPLDALVDLAVYFPSKGESCPDDFEAINHTVTGVKADIARSFWGKTIRIAYRRASWRGRQAVRAAEGRSDGKAPRWVKPRLASALLSFCRSTHGFT
jgi:hypothetical protein